MTENLTQIASKNVADILQYSICFDSTKNKALVIFDTENELTNIVTNAYKNALPQAEFVNFNAHSKEEIIQYFNNMKPQDLVVLIQTGSFRLDDFRIRIHLFNKQLKVIEHLHLYRNEEKTWPIYVNSLAYDAHWYGTMGLNLQKKLASCNTLTIRCFKNAETTQLTVTNGLEIPKLNTGNYEGMKNVGGTFPIGEVFTEAKQLENMNGTFWVYAFADKQFNVIMPEPFKVDIQDGLVVGWSNNAASEFVEVVKNVTALERPIIREIGFGLNRAISKNLPLGDITAFERIVGLHVSLGEKHSVYKKAGITAHKSRFHVDLFLIADEVLVDDEVIFKDGRFVM